MATHISVASGGSPRDGWTVTIVPDAAGTVARPGSTVKVHSWGELKNVADECGVPGREVGGYGLREMVEALGPAPDDDE
jgi:hypothetical protein